MSIVRSAKGELVDFDLLRIKQQIATTPQTSTVAARQTFIDNKMKRRIKKQVQEVVDGSVVANSDTSNESAPIVDTNDITLTIKKEKK
jgi:hypothetical protein